MQVKEEHEIRADIIDHVAKAGGNGPLNLSIVEIIKAAGKQRKVGDNLFLNHHFAPVWHVTGRRGNLGIFSRAVGAALANKMDGTDKHTIVVTADFDHNSGHAWESMLLAGKHNLANLTLIINRATMQHDGHSEHVMPLEPFTSKLTSFNWEAIEVDGHNTDDIAAALSEARASGKPTAIIAHTIPGKGVSFMEHDHTWQHEQLHPHAASAAKRELLDS